MIDVNSFLHSEKIKEIFRFAIVGIIATGIQYGLYLVLNQWMNHNPSYIIGYMVSLAINYWLSTHFTFKTQSSVKKGMGFIASHAINLLLHMVLLNFFIWIGMSKTLAPIPVLCIAIPVNFILVRTALKKI